MSMNETEAAEWLRGDPERQVMGARGEWFHGRGPDAECSDGGEAYELPPFAALPPGTYYPLQPGTELSADLAWAYLSANEARRCHGKRGDRCQYRFRGGQLEYMWVDGSGRGLWVSADKTDCSKHGPYTILPDAQAERATPPETTAERRIPTDRELDLQVKKLIRNGDVWVRESEATERIKALEAERDRERERMWDIHHAVAPGTGGDSAEIVKGRFVELKAERDRFQARIDERDRGLKRLAADLDAAQERYQGVINAQDEELTRLRAEVVELKAERRTIENSCPVAAYHCQEHDCIHGGEAGELREGIEKILRSCDCATELGEELDLEEELKQLLDGTDSSDSGALVESIHEAQQQHIDELEARVGEQAAELADYRRCCEQYALEPSETLEGQLIKMGGEIEGLESEAERLRAELAPYQLPADGEPHEPHGWVLRRVAQQCVKVATKFGPMSSPHAALGVLMEEFQEFMDVVRQKEEARDKRELANEAIDIAVVAIRAAADLGADRDLLPLPTPEPRQLTFAEACAADGTFAATINSVRYEVRDGALVRLDIAEMATMREIFAATWTEVPHV